MVLYQLESLHLDDYNLIYSQNKNRGFDKILTAFPLKTQHFPFTNITQNQPNQQYSSKINPTQPQNSFTTKTKLFLSTFGIFPNIKITKDEARVLFSYLSLFKSPLLSLFDHKGARSGKKPHIELDISQALASSPPFLLSFSRKRDCSRMRSQRPHFGLYPHLSVRSCLAFHTYSHFLIFFWS